MEGKGYNEFVGSVRVPVPPLSFDPWRGDPGVPEWFDPSDLDPSSLWWTSDRGRRGRRKSRQWWRRTEVVDVPTGK